MANAALLKSFSIGREALSSVYTMVYKHAFEISFTPENPRVSSPAFYLLEKSKKTRVATWQSRSIPDASSAMVRNAFISVRFHALHGIVEEEIDQDGIEGRLRVLAPDFAPQKFDAPDTAPPQLDLPPMTAPDGFPVPDVGLEGRAVLEAAEGVEHLGDPIVGEHCDLIDVVEEADALAFEAGPEVRHEDLCALVETDRGAFELVTIVEAGEVVDDEIDESGSGSFGLLNAGGKGSVEMVSQDISSLPKAVNPVPQKGHWQGISRRSEYMLEQTVGAFGFIHPIGWPCDWYS